MKKAKAKKTEQVAVNASKKIKQLPNEEIDVSAEVKIAQAELENSQSELAKVQAELANAQIELSNLQSDKQALQEHSLRLQAEYDNYRRRTQSEKERIYGDAMQNICKELLVLLDNLTRAKDSNEKQLAEQKNLDEQALAVLKSLVKGSDLLDQQAKQLFTKLGVTEIEALGATFNPDYHEAVLHVEDEQYGENEVIEVLQTGYQYGERVLRPAIVKVAN